MVTPVVLDHCRVVLPSRTDCHLVVATGILGGRLLPVPLAPARTGVARLVSDYAVAPRAGQPCAVVVPLNLVLCSERSFSHLDALYRASVMAMRNLTASSPPPDA